MPMTEMIAMIAIVAALALSFIHVLRLLGTLILHKTVRRVIDRDPDRAEALVAGLSRPPEQSGDDRLSTILIAFGIAMIAASLVALFSALSAALTRSTGWVCRWRSSAASASRAIGVSAMPPWTAHRKPRSLPRSAGFC